MFDEVAAPVPQCQRIVVAQVLLVHHLQADVLHLGDDPAGTGELPVGEDVAVDETARGCALCGCRGRVMQWLSSSPPVRSFDFRNRKYAG